MKRAWIIVLVAVLAVSPVFTAKPAVGAEKAKISIAGSVVGGGLYPLAQGVYKMIRKHLRDIKIGPPGATGGSVENTRMLHAKEADLAYTSELYEAYHGTGRWKRDKPMTELRAIYTFPYGGFQIITLADSGIRKMADLKGKRIVLGPAGSGGANRAERIYLPAHGFKKGDYDARFLTYSDACKALRDGAVDVVMMSVRAPAPAVMELVAFKKIYMITMELDAVKEISKKMPKLSLTFIKPDVYGKNQVNTEPIATTDLIVALGTRADVDEELIYRITKMFWEHLDEFHKVSKTAGFTTLEDALKAMPIPLHPGAESYYKEINHPKLKEAQAVQ